MRSPSHLRQPLNTVLGSEGAVRVLRELVLGGRSLSVSVLAKRTGLSRSGVQNVLSNLVGAGAVREAGVGHGAIFEVAPDHPLGDVLHSLFIAEHGHYHRILEGIRDAARRLDPPALAVWLYGSVARGDDTVGSDFDLALIVADDEAVEVVIDRFREDLASLGTAQQVTFSTIGLSLADAERLSGESDPFWAVLSFEAHALHGPRADQLLTDHRVRSKESPSRLRNCNGN